MHDDIGRGSFLAVYFATGALSSYLSLTVNVLQRFLISSSVGASGAVMGVIAAWLSYHSEYVLHRRTAQRQSTNPNPQRGLLAHLPPS